MNAPALLFAVLSFAAASLSGAAAEAQESPRVVRSELVYRAPQGCPSRADLVRRATSRFPNVTFDAAKSSTSFLVTIAQAQEAAQSKGTADGGSYAAELESAGPSGPQHRELHAPTCAELVDAVGLLIALTLDADNTKADPAPREPLPPPPQPVVPRGSYVPFVRLSTIGEFGALPHAALGVGGAFGFERVRAEGILAPSFAVAPSVLTSNILAPTPSLGSYTRFGLRGEVCPLRLGLGAAFAVRPCAFVGLAAIRAEGTAAPNPETAVRFWSDLGLMLRARVEINAFFVEAEGGAGVPLTRLNYVLTQPNLTLYETPPVFGMTALSVGLRFL